MLHEIISKKKTGGNNGSRGVMNYMLRERDGSPRKGATVLRGDVETQAKLIDSLVGKFKQQYITGCFSFEEAPDQVSELQKNELMDMAEEAILAGLEPDRLSITWIEHTDKRRLELNYIVAQVDLEHGRSFQPYVHSHDKDRFNALCTIQNIKHGYTEPSDPAKAQHFKQAPRLPSETKELKKVLNSHIENLAIDGVINNRDDLVKAFDDLGFSVSRTGKKSISFKRPDGGRNLKFVSSDEGGLYGIKFDSSAENTAKITRASADFRASAGQRLATAQKVYERELERKRKYHKDRHSRPKIEQRGLKKPVNPAFAGYTNFDGRYARTVPNPFIDTIRKRKDRSQDLDRQSQYRYRGNEKYPALSDERAEEIYRGNDRYSQPTDDGGYREPRAAAISIPQRQSKKLSNSSVSDIDVNNDIQRTNWGNDSEISNRATNANLQIRPVHRASDILSISGLNDYEQTAIRPSETGSRESTGYYRSTAEHHRESKQVLRAEREIYRPIDDLIRKIGANTENGASEASEFVRGLKNLDKGGRERVQKIDERTAKLYKNTEYFSKRVDITSRQANDVNSDNDSVSERVTTARQLNERVTAARNEFERTKTDTERNRQLKKSFDSYAEQNRQSNSRGKQVVEWARKQLAVKEQANKPKSVERSRSYSSSPRP